MRSVVAFFSWIIAKIQLPSRRVTSVQIDRANKTVKIGDIILTQQRYSFANLFIPGFYTHAALIVDKIDGDWIVIEATTHKSHTIKLEHMLLQKDAFAIYSPRRIPNEDRIKGAYVGFTNVKYDYWFNPRNRSLYCSELCVRILNLSGQYRFKQENLLGEMYWAPDSFCKTDDFDCLMDTKTLAIEKSIG